MQPLLCIPDWTGPSQSKELAGVWFSRRYSFYSIPLPHPLPEPPRILSVGGCVSLCPSGQEASGQPQHSDTWSDGEREYFKSELSFRDCDMWFPEARVP